MTLSFAQEIEKLRLQPHQTPIARHAKLSWQPDPNQLVIAYLGNNNFVREFVQNLFEEHSPTTEPIYRGQKRVSRIFRLKQEDHEESPNFSLEMLRNITKATQKMVKEALNRKFEVSLKVEAFYYTHEIDRHTRAWADPIAVGPQYRATGNLIISS